MAAPLLIEAPLTNVIPFGTRTQRAAAYGLSLARRWQRVSKTQPWLQPREPERLGNLLQRLTFDHPAAVLVIENLVAEMVAQIDKGL